MAVEHPGLRGTPEFSEGRIDVPYRGVSREPATVAPWEQDGPELPEDLMWADDVAKSAGITVAKVLVAARVQKKASGLTTVGDRAAVRREWVEARREVER